MATKYGIKISKPGFDVKTCEDKDLVFITDNELIPRNGSITKWDDFVTFCKDADILIHDAQYLNSELTNNSGFGHSSYEQALQLGLDSTVKNLIFFHHNPGRKDIEIDAILKNIENDLQLSNINLLLSAAKEGQIIEI